MNELDFKIAGAAYLDNAYVYVDGKPVKLKKNQYKNITYHHKTDSDNVKIRICQYADFGGIVWFIVQLLLFVVSIFGIFDTHKVNRGVCFDCTLDVKLHGRNSMTLRCNTPRNGQKVFDVETDAQSEEHDNSYCIPQNAARTFKILKFSKIMLALAIVAIVSISIAVAVI